MKKNNSSKFLSFETLFKSNLKVKLTTLLLIISLFKLQANAYSQDVKISVSIDNITIEELFNKIEKLTKLRIVYNIAEINLKRKVSIEANEKTVSEILTPLFINSNVYFTIKRKHIIFRKPTPEDFLKIKSFKDKRNQDRVIKGKIIDELGQPLLGATVQIKGTKVGTTTDFYGVFKLENVKKGTILKISHIGFETLEVPLGNETFIDIVLKKASNNLNEVVLLGYGSVKKEQLASAVTQLKGKEIKKGSSMNLTESLQGRVSGLFINQTSSDPGAEKFSVLVRGLGNFGDRDNSALIVVDGIIGRDNLARLDPQDIENISVIKDASASVYGARAANGVILVTTKRGKKGESATVTARSSLSISSPTTLVKGATAYDYARQVNAMRVRAGQDPLYSSNKLEDFKSGKAKSIDFWKELFDKQSIERRVNVSVRGGGKTANYFTSLGFLQQGAIVNFDDVTSYKQYNVRSNFDFNPLESIYLGVDLAGRLERRKAPPYMFQAVDNTSKIIPINESYKKDGKFIKLLNQDNPFSYLESRSGINSSENTLFNGTLRFNYKSPIEGLMLKSWMAIDFTQNYANSFNNKPVQYLKAADGSLTENSIALDVKVKDSYYRRLSSTYNIRFVYKRSFEAHSIDTFIGFEQNHINYNTNNLSRRNGLISNSLPYLNQGDPDTAVTSSQTFQTARQAYLGRLSYDFSKKYLASFGFRYDGSYKFPKGNRFGFFPYVSAGWVLTKENFLSDIKGVKFIKLRGTWGITGNDRVDAYQFLNRFEIPAQGGGSFFLDPGDRNSNGVSLAGVNNTILSPVGVSPNPNITWERVQSWDIGLEARFLSNKINFEIDYFSEERSNILTKKNVSVPSYTGLVLPDENIGKTTNHGVDVVLGYHESIKDVSFDIQGNISYARNTLVFFDEPKREESYQQLEGHPIGSRLLYDAIGIYRTKEDLEKYPAKLDGTQIGDLIIRDTNKDGKITTADRTIQEKSITPRMQYGISLNVSYKNFSLSSLFQGQAGSALSIASLLNNGTSSASYFSKNAWTPSTPNASLPAIGGTKTTLNGYTSYSNNFFTYDTNFIRLKSLQLSYHFPKSVLKSLKLKDCTFYLRGVNLLTFSDFNKLNFADVEQTSGLGYNRPLRKLYNFGFQFSF